MKTWKMHWDRQLYKALEHQYQMGLEALNENLPEIKVELVFRLELSVRMWSNSRPTRWPTCWPTRVGGIGFFTFTQLFEMRCFLLPFELLCYITFFSSVIWHTTWKWSGTFMHF